MKRLKLFIAIALFLCFTFLFAACNKVMLDTPVGLNISEAYVLYWSNVTDARDYEMEIKNVESGETNSIPSTSRRTIYDCSHLDPGSYEIKVKAIGGRNNDIYSEWSEPILFERPYETGLKFTAINGNTAYMVTAVGSASGDVVIEDFYRGKPVTAIGPKAFSGKGSSKIESVVISSNVTYIGDNAFQNCSKLASVTIPDSVTYMGVGVFQGCHALTKVNIPQGIDTIPESTFGNCYALEDIEIGDNIMFIEQKAFTACRGIEKIELSDNVLYIGANAFSGARALESVTFGKNIQIIAQNAFSGCSVLREVKFSSETDGMIQEYGLTLGDNVFQNCPALTSITLPDGVTEIGAYAFYQCSGLESVTIPDTVTSIGEFAFHDTALYKNQLEVKDGEQYSGYVYADKWLVAVNNDIKLNITKMDENTFKPDTVGIAARVFLTSVRTESGTATKGCPSLTEVTLGSSIKYIGEYAFYACDILNSFIVPENGQLVSVGDRAFEKCGRLNNVQFLGSNLKVIGSYAFLDCATLNNRNSGRLAPDTLERIGTYAFNGTALWTIAGNSGDEATATNGIAYADNWVVGYNNITDPVVALKSGVIGIADYAFYNCEQLQSITGLGQIEHLGRGAFYGCAVLGSIMIGDNISEIKENTFYGCSALFSVSMPISLQTIGENAFSGCSMLDTIDLSSTRVTSIGDYAFNRCQSVREVKFPEPDADGVGRLTTIGDFAFFGCEAVESLSIPNGVISIGQRAFSNWKKLVDLDLGETVVELGNMAFMNCELLATVKLPDSVAIVGDYCFYNCAVLTEVDFGNGVMSIGRYAFAISPLTNVVLPESVIYIGEFAFKNCRELTSVIMRGMPVYIGAHAFYGDYVLSIYMVSSDADPATWSLRWNSSQRPVIRGAELSDDGSYIAAFTASPELITNPFARGGFFAPSRAGYDFVGWATEPNGEAVYGADEWRNAEIGTKLYAVWQESAEPEPTPEPTPEPDETENG